VIARLASVGVVLVAAAVAAVLLGSGSPGSDPYRVAAIFNNADFLVKGQDVKIAGAVEGSVTAVRLTPDNRARVEIEVNRKFGPFHSDASCTIRPLSLIGEKLVDCVPGTPQGKALKPGPDGVPTLPIARNHSPVDLDLVFDALRLPYRQRLTLLVNELGVGLAGRPAELNAAIRQANPAIQRANQVLAILDRDRGTLARLIDSSDAVLAQLASHRGEVASFIGRADRVAQAVASRRGDLGLAIHRLPPMLDQLEPTATDLAALADDAQPVARDLRTAADPVRRLFGDLGPLTDAAGPTLKALNELSATGRHAIRSTTPVARMLLPIARRLPEVSKLARLLNESLRDRGAIEGLVQFVYYGSAATARFDVTSHILPSYQIAGTCQVYATTPAPGCSARYTGAAGSSKRTADRRPQTAGTAKGRKPRKGRRTGRERPKHCPAVCGLPSAVPEAPAQPTAPGGAAPPAPPALQQALDYLLRP
jgi:ABC-type transporter Mla subunit MlaD